MTARFAEGITVISQPCPGLAEAVEAGALDTPETERLVRLYVEPLLARDQIPKMRDEIDNNGANGVR